MMTTTTIMNNCNDNEEVYSHCHVLYFDSLGMTMMTDDINDNDEEKVYSHFHTLHFDSPGVGGLIQ